MALAPAQSTLTVMIRKVLDYIMSKNDSEIDQVATDAINDGINEINLRNWRKLIKQDDTVLVADTRAYAIPTDFRAPRSLERWDSSDKSDGRIAHVALKTLLNEYPQSTDSGTPSVYAIDTQGRELMFNVAPNASFVSKYPKYNLWYHYNQPHLSGAGTIDLPTSFEVFLVWNARANLASFRRPEAARFAYRKAERALADLVADDNDTMTDWE